MKKPIQEDVVKAIQILKKHYPAKGMVDMGNPEDTLLATLMSARTTDVQVLKVYPSFRKKFPSWPSLAKADVKEIANMINTIGLYRAKAKAIKGLAQVILTDFYGKVPQRIEELVTLPGVGRKTASCVLWYGYGIPAMAVDTHVFRITRRLGWAKGKNPEKVEQELLELVPKRWWGEVNRTMVQFGRDVCVGGRKPECWRCPIAAYCAYSPKTPPPKSA